MALELDTIHTGDCREALAGFPDNSVHAIVTDPPYGLRFLGAKWDCSVPGVDVWLECLRVLRPGGHLLAFAGTRTQHRMAVNIEDGGFHIRDMIAWVYGGGFPKSLDVSKAIDKVRDEDAEPVRVICRAIRAAMDALKLKARDLVNLFGGCHPQLIGHWAARDTDSQPALPTWDQWVILRDKLSMSADLDGEVRRLNDRKGTPGDTWRDADVLGEHEGVPGGLAGDRFTCRDNLIREPSDAAREWAGWGTALKPAFEPITVARKPFAGTVAANVLAHGTGAINVDGCRVGTEEVVNTPAGSPCDVMKTGLKNDAPPTVAAGRWPANFIHDGSDEVTGLFPTTSGDARQRQDGTRPAGFGNVGANAGNGQPCGELYSDPGSAARFFYCAKASTAERNEGCGKFPETQAQRTLSGSEDTRGRPIPINKNTHATVKPLALMRYLCRLVTPPGGIVLDPFAGSGTTCIAAYQEGFHYIGVEMDPEYVAIANARIKHAKSKFALFDGVPA